MRAENSTAVNQQNAEPAVVYRLFCPGDETAFRLLNEAWINHYFVLEEVDREVLGDPEKYILQPGGAILCATAGAEVIGCCALIREGPDSYELAKMAISEALRGKGIGRGLLLFAIRYAREIGARHLHLETNSKLVNAIHLYEAVGFCHIPSGQRKASPYARADVAMELFFEE